MKIRLRWPIKYLMLASFDVLIFFCKHTAVDAFMEIAVSEKKAKA
jgi:hypothetical protein